MLNRVKRCINANWIRSVVILFTCFVNFFKGELQVVLYGKSMKNLKELVITDLHVPIDS